MSFDSASFGEIGPPPDKGHEGVELVPDYPPPSGGGLGLFVKIGPDDRVQVSDTTEYPWRCVCHLDIRMGDGSSEQGTGWLVSPRTVITAGHCVFDHDCGGWIRRVEVAPGRQGRQRFYGYCVATQFDCADEWRKNRMAELDYGAIFLPDDCRYGDKLGYFGYADLATEELEDVTVCLSGYPIDKIDKTVKTDKELAATQWYHERRLEQVTAISLYHKIDTFFGQSGAPLWRVKQDGDRYVVGIHNGGKSIINHATRLNDAVYSQIKHWKAEGR